MTSTYWQKFFKSAGIPQPDVIDYAQIFEDNRITDSMLGDLRKEHLVDMGIRRMGDIIGILKCASDWASVAKQQKPASRPQPAEHQASPVDNGRAHKDTKARPTAIAAVEKQSVKLVDSSLSNSKDKVGVSSANASAANKSRSIEQQPLSQPQQRVVFTRLGELSSAGRAVAAAAACVAPSNKSVPSNQSVTAKKISFSTDSATPPSGSSVFNRLGDLPAATTGGRTVLPPPPPPLPLPLPSQPKRKIRVDIDEELEPDDEELADLGKLLARTSRSGAGGRLFLRGDEDDSDRADEPVVKKPLRLVDRWSITKSASGSSTSASATATVRLQQHHQQQPVRKAEAHSTVDEFQHQQRRTGISSSATAAVAPTRVHVSLKPTLYSDEEAPRASSSSSRQVAASLLQVRRGSRGTADVRDDDFRDGSSGGGGDRRSLVNTGRSGSSGRRELDHRADGSHQHPYPAANASSAGAASNSSRFTRIVVHRSTR